MSKVDNSLNNLNSEIIPAGSYFEELGKIKMTSFIKEYGTKWRWALLVHLASIFKKLDIQEIDLESMAFTANMRDEEGKLHSEEIEEFFQAFYNIISKLCLVKTSVTPLAKMEADQQKESFLIHIH